MHSIVHSQKSVTQASKDLEEAVMASGLSVMHVHNLGQSLGPNGADKSEECKIFDICNPVIATEHTDNEVLFNMAFNYRISIYNEQGKTIIGLTKPELLLESFLDYPKYLDIADSIEKTLIQIMQDIK